MVVSDVQLRLAWSFMLSQFYLVMGQAPVCSCLSKRKVGFRTTLPHKSQLLSIQSIQIKTRGPHTGGGGRVLQHTKEKIISLGVLGY